MHLLNPHYNKDAIRQTSHNKEREKERMKKNFFFLVKIPNDTNGNQFCDNNNDNNHCKTENLD